MSHPALGDLRAAGDLKQKTARGVLTSAAGQAANFGLRIGSMVVMARLVTPEHFGLVGMVTAFVGLLSLFRDAGLSMATVQRETISHEQVSTLFWANVAIGAVLGGLAAAAAPAVAAFYGDSRLVWIMLALSSSFVFNGAMAQHRALLQRQMRFGALATIDILAVLVSIVVGVSMAVAGLGYWALVGMAVSLPFANLIGVWVVTGWTPGLPRQVEGLRSMLHYGGVVTLNGLVVYVAYNADKVLLGRFFGAEALGIYGRAYQLITLPTENLHTTLGWVMFPALARVQNDPPRQRNYLLKGYGLFLSVVLPITLACGVFADEIVHVFLGPQWTEAVPIFRALAPTVLAFALINPMGHLMMSSGLAVRSLKIALLIAPVVIAGYLAGLSRGPIGVALGFSCAMLLLVVPVVQWAKHGTLITAGDLVRAAIPPLTGTLLGGAVAVAGGVLLGPVGAFARLAALSALMFGTHLLVLVLFPGQKALYRELLDSLRGGSRVAAAPAGVAVDR